MTFIKAAFLPVRGIPLSLFSSGLIGISVSDYISRLTGFYLRPIFVFLLSISNGFGVKVEEGKSYLLSYGRGEGFLKLTKEAMKNASTSGGHGANLAYEGQGNERG